MFGSTQLSSVWVKSEAEEVNFHFLYHFVHLERLVFVTIFPFSFIFKIRVSCGFR